MRSVQQALQDKVAAALAVCVDAAVLAAVSADALQVVPCAHAQFGDYQFNGALPLAKTARQNPRVLAGLLVERLDVGGMSEPPQIAGPGFINFRLLPSFVEQEAKEAMGDPRLGVPKAERLKTVVVDFSAPNVAKPMHVGHIRSTIIGDAIARLLRFAGHTVLTDNHIGDWGTQFGKIIVGWKKHLNQDNLKQDPIAEMERLYRLVHQQSETDEAVADEARAEIARLQNGDPDNLAIWQQVRELSQHQFDDIYGRLGVEFDQTLGESFYNERLPAVISDLREKGLAVESEGALVVKFPEPSRLADKPMLVQKRDGSALYATTDLATIQFRMETWHPDEIIYVVDARQSLHFEQLFEAARMWGYGDVGLRHISFGSILGEDNTPLKTRSGETIKLKDLLDEAEQRALATVLEKNPDMDAAQRERVARVLGIGGIKYVDLSQNRASDYVFTWEKMLADKGNTAVYLEYAYVRIRSILRKAEPATAASALHLEHPAELELAKFLLRLPLALEAALADYRPNALTDYLFDLAQRYTTFYDACPVLGSEPALRLSRLALCNFTAEVMRLGLSLLGIDTIEKM